MPGLDKMREAKSGEQPTSPAQSDGFATAADFKNRFKTSTYTLQDGLTIKFRALLPMDFATFRGSALSARMTEVGLSYTNDEARTEYVEQMPSLARTEVVIEAAKDAIIQAVIHPQFTALPPDKCPPNKVSLDMLSPSEILELDSAIRKFSGGDEDEETFREPSETDAEDTGESDATGEDEHVDGSTDSEGVQPESA